MRRIVLVASLALVGAVAQSRAGGAPAPLDPLQAPECRQALAALQEQEAAAASTPTPRAPAPERRGARAADPRLEASRQRAARACLASRADPPPAPGRFAQPPMAVPPVVAAQPALPSTTNAPTTT